MKKALQRVRASAIALLILSASASCSDSTGLSSLVGTYVATEWFWTATNGNSFDLLANGESLVITIKEDGTNTGTHHNTLASENDFDVSVAGTVTRNGDKVTFHSTHSEGSVLTDHRWFIVGTTLVGTVEDGGLTSNITLTRQ
jgi:hypothetical protein